MSEIVMLGRALITIAGFALIVGLSTFAGCYSVMKPVAEYGIARQHTEQTRIEWTERTEQTRIEWDGRVAIAEIEADATKKTSFEFSLFWLIRFFTWVLAILIAVYIVALIIKSRAQVQHAKAQ